MEMNKKEYLQLKLDGQKPSKSLNPLFLDDMIGLMPHTGQRFIDNYINVNTTHTRLLVKHRTGLGKTIASLLAGLSHIKFFKDNDDAEPFVFIIGFSSHIFKRELLTRKEFGFVREYEIQEHKRLKYIAEKGTNLDKQNLKDFEKKLKRRLTNKDYGGYFRFIGYKEFYNKLFIGEDTEVFSEEELYSAIEDGKIQLNWSLIKTFANSLIICDEIHNVYNSVEINNYGIALQLLLDLYDVPPEWITVPDKYKELLKQRVVKVLFMSATPINNNPQEIVDLINLLVPASELFKKVKKYKLTRNDLFAGNEPKLDKIEELVQDYTSFLTSKDPNIYPNRIMNGDSIKGIKYLKFIKCKISPEHKKVYKQIYDKKTNTIPTDSYMLTDIIIPIPGGFSSSYKKIKQSIINADRKWLDKTQIEGVGIPWTTTGSFLNIQNIGKYSIKYKKMVQYIDDNLKNNGGKLYINHQRVKGSGVLLIEQILLQNGIIDEFSNPVESTKCSICGIILKDHSDSHQFIPTRYVSAHGNLDSNVINTSIEKYNDISNIFGYKYRILIGSKKTNEGMDLKEVQHILVMSVPDDISTLLQILGRGIRNKSHIRLPPDNRTVYVSLFITTDSVPMYEELKYKQKMKYYITIQKIEKILNRTAVDANIHRSIIEPSLSHGLGDLWFEPVEKLSKKVDYSTFVFFRDEEINLISYLIKRLLLEQSDIWTLKDLWETIKDPPYEVPNNTKMFDYDNFIIAVDNLLWDDSISINFDKKLNLMDYNQKYLVINDIPHTVVMVEDKELYLILLPLNGQNVDIKSVDERKKYTALGTSIEDINGFPDLSLGINTTKNNIFNITNGLKNINLSYNNIKLRFFEQYRKIPIQHLPLSLEVYDLKFHRQLIEDSIKYAFNIMVNPQMSFSELHKFYFKMIYFYDRLDMIVYADHLMDYPELLDPYKKYVEIAKDMEYNSFLQSSIIKSTEPLQVFEINRLNKYLRKKRSKKINERSEWRTGIKIKTDMKYMTVKIIDIEKINKTPIKMLPIGHFLDQNNIPMLYLPDSEWYKASKIIRQQNVDIVENDIIVGYYEKSTSSLEMTLKLRTPKRDSDTTKDLRLVERGIACTSKSKKELKEIANSLGIKSDDSTKKICSLIKQELMKRELDARRKYKHDKKQKQIKWFYMHFEEQI